MIPENAREVRRGGGGGRRECICLDMEEGGIESIFKTKT